MTRESLFYKIISGIHVVLFTSILTFGLMFLTLGLFAVPLFGAAFMMGKDVMCKTLDINDSIVKVYFGYLKKSGKLFRFIPVTLIALLNSVGMILTARAGQILYSTVCLVIVAFMFVVSLYIAGYHTFVAEKFSIPDVMIALLLKPQYLIPVFVIVVLAVFFASLTEALILFFSGTFFLFVIEVLVLLQMLHYKKLTGTLDEDELSYLIGYSDKEK